ncbi:MAG: alpha/beta fold hydrolase [Caldilinea sp.]|nr:alpha/beta fold hydrolase [Caldilinea sp.]MDW8439034.1 alpha/beta fold hydrolase [Caldilineaceae bacterium]
MWLPRDRFVEIDGLQLRYWLEGEAGPNIVLIHGIGGAVDVWRRQFEQLRKTHCVLALDLPGCGRSAIPPDFPPDALRMLAAAVRRVMQAVGMERATLVGSSLGGAVAVEFAIRWPEIVSSLVLIAPAGMTHQVAWSLRLMTVPVLGECLTRPSRSRTAQAIRQCVADPAGVEEDDIDRAFAMASLSGAQAAFLRLLRTYASLFGLDRRELRRLQQGMRTIQAPTLLIWGGRDRIIPLSAAYVALKHLPNAGLIVRPDSGHLVFVDEPAWFDRTLVEFVQAPERMLAVLRLQTPAPRVEPFPAQLLTRLRTLPAVTASVRLNPRIRTVAALALLALVALPVGQGAMRRPWR